MPTALREADVKRQVRVLLQGLGCAIYSFSQARPSRQTLGVPDLYVFPPFGKAPFWVEAKAPEGKQRPDQRRFQSCCEACGAAYVLGGRPEVELHLRQIGVL